MVNKDFHKVYVLPVLMYGSKAWSVTKTLARRLDAFDSWSLRKILRIPYTRHITNALVRQTTGCCPVSHLQERRLRRITVGLLRRRSDRPVIGGDLADAHVPRG